MTDREKGARNGGATAFLVDRSMGWRSEFIQTMGEGGPASLIFDGVRVPHRNILGEIGQGFTLGMEWIGKGRYTIPSHAIGIAERVLQMAIDHANTRETFGAKIGTNQAIQWMIADSETELEAARWLVLRSAWTVDQGLDPGTPRRWASSTAPAWSTGWSTGCSRSTAAWATPVSCPSNAGTGRSGSTGSSRAPTRCSG